MADANFPERRIRKDFSDGDADFEASFYLIHQVVMLTIPTKIEMIVIQHDAAYLMSK